MTPLTAASVLEALAAFPELPEPPHDPRARMRWMAARFDAGDRVGAAHAAVAELASGRLERAFAVDGPRILASLPPERSLPAILGVRQLRDPWTGSGSRRKDYIAAVLAPAVAGTPAAEETLLRGVLEPTDHERRLPDLRSRRLRISGVVAAYSRAYPPDAGDAVERWRAVLTASPYDDRSCLAAAAAQLAPLGFAEIVARCGDVADHDGPALAAALGAAGHIEDAVRLAGRLCAAARQDALLRIAETAGSDAGDAVIAAFRKAPKTGRAALDRQLWLERLGGLQLRYGRIDDAFATLTSIEGSRYVGYGAARLIQRILHNLDPADATPARLRTILTILPSDAVTTSDLADLVTEAIMLLYPLADTDLRAEITATHIPVLLSRLRGHRSELVTAGLTLAGARPDGGDPIVWIGRTTLVQEAAIAAGLPAARPDVYARAAARSLAIRRPNVVDPVAPLVLPAIPAGHLASALADLPDGQRAQAAVNLAVAADDDLRLLALAFTAAPDATTVHAVARCAVSALARDGDLDGAYRVADVCRLSPPPPRTAPR